MNATQDLCKLSARDLAAAIAARDVSSLEAVEAYLAQIEDVNPAINAIAILDAEHARNLAREADDALAHGSRTGRLHGVPFTLKDAHATAGMRSTLGFPPFDHVPSADGTIPARLKSEGAILIGKTNVPSLLADHQTANPIFGRTNNPADLSRTPGGSSGGAAAAIASHMTPFDVGTDLSSSIRLPAHFCGAYGLKPTEHRVSLDGVFPLPGNPPRPVRIMSCVGPLARSLDDLALIFSIIAGPDNRDTDVAPVPLEMPQRGSAKPLRIGVISSIEGLPLAKELRDLVERVANTLAANGATVESATPPPVDIGQDMRAFGNLIGLMMDAFGPHGDGDVRLASYFRALDARDRTITAWESLFRTYDALLTPPAMTTAFPHVESGTPIDVDGTPQPYELLTAYGDLFNYTGHPAMSVPCGFDRSRLPMGVQLVAARYREATLFDAARLIASR